eukprot:TRINITY_DN2131_c0_g1_i1.p1 TRINITY_DN2131_c0_g1~~TRINITY_DN2131_c0_g1_i1.p1  ORF type:complete len:253 (-),score=22.33 TRINITY_DN2131_c0_g1_i1:487-1245(-)
MGQICRHFHLLRTARLGIVLLFFTAYSLFLHVPITAGADVPPTCAPQGLPLVRSLAEFHQDSYGRSGLSHITVAGAVHHGMQEVEVWMQTFAPGAGTPIHRHACEEVFVVLGGHGTLSMEAVALDADWAPASRSASAGLSFCAEEGNGGAEKREGPEGTPGGIARCDGPMGPPVQTAIFRNATFVIKPDAVHQVTNTALEGDLQLLVVISRPPIRVYTYPSWDATRTNGHLAYPYPWDAVCPFETERKGKSL